MSQPQTPWPVDDGSLAFAYVIQLSQVLVERGTISADDVATAVNRTIAHAGDQAAQDGARHQLRKAFPQLAL